MLKQEISLDIFQEAIGESFAQYPSDNRRNGTNEEEEDKRTYRSLLEDRG